jgi:hypothetical protein
MYNINQKAVAQRHQITLNPSDVSRGKRGDEGYIVPKKPLSTFFWPQNKQRCPKSWESHQSYLRVSCKISCIGLTRDISTALPSFQLINK